MYDELGIHLGELSFGVAVPGTILPNAAARAAGILPSGVDPTSGAIVVPGGDGEVAEVRFEQKLGTPSSSFGVSGPWSGGGAALRGGGAGVLSPPPPGGGGHGSYRSRRRRHHRR